MFHNVYGEIRRIRRLVYSLFFFSLLSYHVPFCSMVVQCQQAKNTTTQQGVEHVMHTGWWKSMREERRRSTPHDLGNVWCVEPKEKLPVRGWLCVLETWKHPNTVPLMRSDGLAAIPVQNSGSTTSAAQRPCDASRDVPGRPFWQSAFHSRFLFMRETRGASRIRLSVVLGLRRSSAQFTVSPKVPPVRNSSIASEMSSWHPNRHDCALQECMDGSKWQT